MGLAIVEQAVVAGGDIDPIHLRQNIPTFQSSGFGRRVRVGKEYDGKQGA